MSEFMFGLYQTADSLIIHNILKSKLLSIDKEYLSIQIKDASYLSTIATLGESKALGILGILNLGMMEFLVYIKSSIKVGNIGNKEIFEIKDINFLGLSNNIKVNEEIISIFTEIRSILQQGFYYSHNFDLTNSLQNQKIIKIKNNYQYDIVKHADKNYLWNFELNSRFYDYDVDSDFIVNCICGYVGIISEKINDHDSLTVDYILISRRSCNNAGVKLIKKGLDGNGHAANFIETEQIVINGSNIFSFVQVRGSPPAIFDKETIQNIAEDKSNLSSNHNINGNNNNSTGKNKLNLSFEKHISNLLSHSYQLIFLINLMNLSKQNEQLATNLIEDVIRQNEYKNLKYVFFDYFNETKCNLNPILLEKKSNGSRDNIDYDINNDPVDNFLKKIENIFLLFKYFGIYNKKTGTQDSNGKISIENGGYNLYNPIIYNNHEQISCDQIGVIRSFCYDALERTNMIQMRIAWKILLIQLNEIDVDTISLLGGSFNNDVNISDISDNILNITNNSNTTQSKSIGKENSNDLIIFDKYETSETIEISLDKLNLIPVKENLDKSQKLNTHSFINSFKKLWLENGNKIAQQYTGGIGLTTSYVDQQYIMKQNLKQRCIDILLQKFQPAFHKTNSELIKKELVNFAHKFTSKQKLNIFVGTWNVGGQIPTKDLSLLEFLYPKSLDKAKPDIYFIGLQEIVELSANYVLISSNQPRVEYWRTAIKDNLDKIDK